MNILKAEVIPFMEASMVAVKVVTDVSSWLTTLCNVTVPDDERTCFHSSFIVGFQVSGKGFTKVIFLHFVFGLRGLGAPCFTDAQGRL